MNNNVYVVIYELDPSQTIIGKKIFSTWCKADEYRKERANVDSPEYRQWYRVETLEIL